MRQARIAAEERDRARKEATKADRLNAFLQNILGFSDPTWLSPNPQRDRGATIADALDEAGRRAATELADEPETLAAVHFTIGWTYKALGQLDKAEPHLRASLEIRQKVLGPDHQDTAQSMIGLGEFYIFGGKYSEGEEIDRAAVDIYRRAAAAGSVDPKWFSIALNDLGAANIALGRSASGEPLMKEALEIARGFTGQARAPACVMLSNLGVMRKDRGDLAGARSYLEDSLREYHALPRQTPFEQATAMHNFAFVLTLQEEYDRAEPLAREAFEALRNSVGEKHAYTPRPLLTLALIAFRRSDYGKAREEVDHALSLQERGLPAGHADFAQSWTLLGRVLTRVGDTAGAESYLRRALELRLKKLPPGHTYIAETEAALADCLAAQLRIDEAEPLLTKAVATLRTNLGETDPRTVEATQQLTTVHAASSGASAAR